MKNFKHFRHVVAIASAILLMGCETTPSARVVRLKLEHNSNRWEYSLNGSGRVLLSAESMTKQIAHLRLHHGDLVLFGMVPIRTNGPAATWNCLADCCISNQVSIYYYIESSGDEIFSLPVYHWVAPFDNPRTLVNASFFREGDFLGRRDIGFKNMVTSISRANSPQVFILGSAYDLNTSFGPNEAPYENEEQLLESAAEKNHIKLIFLHPLLGF